jgi:hypothetical protein
LQGDAAMNPDDPASAQQIVAEYARVLERDLEHGSLPAPIESLPFAKPDIKTAIETSVASLAASGLLTGELRGFLQTAYVSLADYVSPDVVRLMREFTDAGEDLAAQPQGVREKISTPAWRTVSESSRLAGEIAQSIASEAEELRTEFEQLIE